MLMMPLILLPSFGAQVTNDLLLYRERNDELRKLAQSSADVYNTELDQIVSGIQRLLGAVAQLEPVNSLRPHRCDRTLADLVQQYPNDVILAATDVAGKVICSSLTHRTEVSLSDRPFFSQATSRFVVGGFATSRLSGERVLPFAAPILRDGLPTGVLIASLSLNWLEASLQRPPLAPGQSLIVTDGDGVVLAELPQKTARIGKKLPARYLSMIRAHGPGVVELPDEQNRPTIYGYVPATVPPPDIYLLFGIDREIAFAPIKAATTRSVAFGLLSAIIALSMAWLIGVRFVRRPIGHLVAAAEAWRSGDYLKRAELRAGPAELRYLGAAFDRMADALRLRDKQVADASRFKDMILAAAGHDLRQPLQTIVAALYGLSRQGPIDAKQRYLARAEHAVGRLNDQLNLLIETARTREKTARAQQEPFTVPPLLQEAAQRWQVEASRKRLRLLVKGVGAPIVGDRQLLAIVIDNLVGNAVKYTNRGGILLACRCRRSEFWIEVYDTGIGIPAAAIASIFEDFHQLDPQREGFGLGLWIARTATETLGGKLTVCSVEGHGSRFRIALPHRAAVALEQHSGGAASA
jgi:signal transduction histidine kinase